MALVKTTFYTALETQLKGLLEPLYLAGTESLPDTNPSGDVQIKQPAIDAATAKADQMASAIAQAVSDQVDVYIKTATVTVALGIPVATAGTAVAQTGATTAPGVGVIS
jgi:hypothetical protein